MDGQVPEAAKAERLARLQALLEAHRQDFNRGTVGRRLSVLVEKPGRHPGQVAGKSPYLQAVQFESATHGPGDLVEVAVTRAGSNSLFGEATAAA
jgi:tRNA-2-methylthio-N6-dimethylallyladenosine synthase